MTRTAFRWILFGTWFCSTIHGYPECLGAWTKEWQNAQRQEDPANPIPEFMRDRFNFYEGLEKEAFDKHECPYGVPLPGDVTWPVPKKDLRERGFVATMDPLIFFSVVWSFMPYFVVLYLICSFLRRRGTRQLWIISWVGIFVILNELVIKKLVHESRPGAMFEVTDYHGKLRGSCLSSCGMPSSHAGLSFGLFILIFLDSSFRVRVLQTHDCGESSRDSGAASRSPSRSQQSRHMAASEAGGSARRRICDDCALWCHSTVIHLDNFETLTPFQFISHVCVWFVILVPSTVARIVLYDHTAKQVLLGQVLGAVMAVSWWWIVRCIQHRLQADIGKSFWFVKHNFPLPDLEPDLERELEEVCSSSE